MPPQISYSSSNFPNASAASPCSPLTSSFNFIHSLKFPQCERSEPLFPLNFVLNFAVLFNFFTSSSIYSSFFPSSGVLGTFFHLDGDSQSICGQFWAGFGELLAVFGGFLADSFVDFSVRFLVPFLRSIFDPFLANSQSRICLFYWTFWPTRVVFGPFLDVFWTVHLPAFSPSSSSWVIAARWLPMGWLHRRDRTSDSVDGS
jgi:hypothetical protein